MSAERSSSTVAKGRTQSRFSFSVRMNRSAQPFPSGSREGRRALDAEEADPGLEVVAHVLAAVIVAQPQAGGDVLGERAEALAHRLPHRLESLEAVRVEGSVMPTHSAEQWSTATNTAA